MWLLLLLLLLDVLVGKCFRCIDRACWTTPRLGHSHRLSEGHVLHLIKVTQRVGLLIRMLAVCWHHPIEEILVNRAVKAVAWRWC